MAADGTEWRVGRKWLPWSPKLRSDLGDIGHFEPGDLFDSPVGVLFGLVALVVAGVVFFFLFPILALVAEILLIAVVLVGGVGARVVLRRPWLVQAESATRRLEWPVVGWRASGAQIKAVAAALEEDRALPAFAEDQGASRSTTHAPS